MMDELTRKHVLNLNITDDADARYESYKYMLAKTQEPVQWSYEIWDQMLALLKTGDNHQRSIAAQVLSGLAKSDPDNRMVKDVGQIFNVMHDEHFVTARHALQSLWKIAIVSPELLKIVTGRLAGRYNNAMSEKNGTLVRSDIIEVFKKVYDKTQDEKVKHHALSLIEKEEDPKYRKKYLGFWKD
jgi:hypothetical protein